MDVKKNEELLMQLSKRLNETGYYLARGSVALIIPAFFKKVSQPAQKELWGIYQKLTTDSKPSVRKFASINFKDMVLLYPKVTEE